MNGHSGYVRTAALGTTLPRQKGTLATRKTPHCHVRKEPLPRTRDHTATSETNPCHTQDSTLPHGRRTAVTRKTPNCHAGNKHLPHQAKTLQVEKTKRKPKEKQTSNKKNIKQSHYKNMFCDPKNPKKNIRQIENARGRTALPHVARQCCHICRLHSTNPKLGNVKF